MIARIAQSAAEEGGLSPAELNVVPCDVLVMLGDDDIVSREHNVQLYRALPNAQLAVVPSASHLLLIEKPAFCTQLVSDFLTTDPKPTMMPIARRN